MVRLQNFVICCIVLLCGIDASSIVNSDAEDFRLSLIHFNDFHARFEETSPTSGKCIPEDHPCIGGFPRLYTAIKQLREKEPDSILLNAGDDFQGTLWYTVLKWNVTQHFMNMLNIDAHAVGNHEFDDGVNGLVPYLKALRAPKLVANMDASDEPTMQGHYKDSLIIERNGVKIGLTGAIIKSTNSLSNTGKLKFTDEIEAVQRVANDLTSQGVNIIIVISHCGLDIDIEMAAKVGNIDIIVGGHSHTLLYPDGEKPPNGEAAGNYPIAVNNTGNTVLIVQAAAYNKYLGNLKVTFDAAGTVKSWTGKPIYLDTSINQDESILKAMDPFKEEVDNVGQRVVGFSAVHLDRSNCLIEDCNIGNYITDAFVEYCIGFAPESDWSLASIGLLNTVSIMNDIKRGNITYEQLFMSQPFANVLQTFQLKGEHLLEALEHSVVVQSRLQVSGLHVIFNMKNDPGKRVVSVKVRCAKCDVPRYEDLNPEAVYTIIAPTFLTNGADGYKCISDNKMNVVDRAKDVEVLEMYLARHNPLYADVEGRITYMM